MQELMALDLNFGSYVFQAGFQANKRDIISGVETEETRKGRILVGLKTCLEGMFGNHFLTNMC